MTPQPAGYIPDAADAAVWRTAKNGKKFQIDTETGEIVKGNVGQKNWDSETAQSSRRDKVEDAVRDIANGKSEATIPGLRNDLEQYGGTNDVTIIKGDSKKGLVHIAERHGQRTIPPVLEAVANGRLVRFSRGNKTVALQKDGYEAILSLEEYGRKKTWLLTGYGLVGNAKNKGALDERGKFCTRHAPTHTEPTSSRPGMGAESPLISIIAEIFAESNAYQQLKEVNAMNSAFKLTFDASPSVRRFDDNGYLHVGASHITKATVNPYYGREIPNFEEAGLEPDKIYYGLRAPEELKKSLPTWSGLPLHIEHHIDSAHDPQKLTRVGAVGTEIVWNAPYVDAPLVVWDSSAIGGIEDGSYRELSCAYRYEPDFTPGEYEGKPYDFVMRNIRGNHVALVEEGRASPDVLVADANIKPITPTTKRGNFMGKLKNWFRGARDADPGIEQKEVDLAQAIIDLHKVDPVTGEVVDIIGDEDKAEEIRKLVEELSRKLEPEEIKKLTDALTDLAYSKATPKPKKVNKMPPAIIL